MKTKPVIPTNEELIETTRVEQDASQSPKNRKRLRTPVIVLLSAIGLVGVTLLVIFVLMPFLRYNHATRLLEQNLFDESIAIFESLGDYKNSPEMVNEATYQKGGDLLNQGKYDEAIDIYTSLGGYKDSGEMVREATYRKAKEFLLGGAFEEAIILFNSLLDYKDSAELEKEAKYLFAKQYLEEEEYYYASELFAEVGEYEDAAALLMQSNYALALLYYQRGFFELAVELFAANPGYEETARYAGLATAMLQIQGTWENDTHNRQFVFFGWKYFMVESPYGENIVTEGSVEKEGITEDQVKIPTGMAGLFIEYDVITNQFVTNYYVSGGIDHGGFDKEYAATTEIDTYSRITNFTFNAKILQIMEPEISLVLVEFPYLIERYSFLADR